MPLEVPFIFDGTANDASVSSLIHIIASYLALPDAERPFSVRHLYHLCRIPSTSASRAH